MLIRCQRCQAVFTLQAGAAAGGATFKVECGRCHEVFETAAPGHLDPPPPQTPATPAPRAREAGALERSATADELAKALRPRRPPSAELKPPPRRWSPVWIFALGGVVLVAVGFLATRAHLGGLSRESQARVDRARQKLLQDDLASLREATRLFTEAARLSPGEARPEAERAFALMLQAATHQDLARRIEASIKAAPPGDAAAQLLQEKLPHVGSGLRLLQEGLAAAKAALEDDGEDPVALRALALHAALVDAPEKGEKAQGQAEKLAPQDPWIAYTRAALALSGLPSREKQDHALAALAVVRQAEPHLLRAQVEAAAISLDRGEAGPARLALSQVLRENPAHERAQRLLAMLPPAP